MEEQKSDLHYVPRAWEMPADYAAQAAAYEKRERLEAIPRHKAWIASISDRDWRQLAERADQVLAGGNFARLEDLDAIIAIYVAAPTEKHRPNGEQFGTLRGCVLMAWPKTQRHRR